MLYFVILILFFVLILFVFKDQKIFVFLLPVVIVLSPRFAIVYFGEHRPIELRVEDLLIVAMITVWLAKIFRYKGVVKITIPPAMPLLLNFLMLAAIATGFGVLMGSVNSLLAIFYIFKYTEFFILYLFVSNIRLNENQAKNLLNIIFTTTLIAEIYIFYQVIAHDPGGIILFSHFMSVEQFKQISGGWSGKLGDPLRMTMPFDAEPSAVGGYFVIITPLLISTYFFISAKPYLLFLILGALFSVGLAQSRSGIASMMIVLSFSLLLYLFVKFSQKNRYVLLIVTIFVGIIAVIMLTAFGARLFTYYLPIFATSGLTALRKIYNIYDITGESLDLRINNWFQLLKQIWMQQPLLGEGISGRVVDNYYIWVLAETGALGFINFIFVLLTLLQNNWNLFLKSRHNVNKAISFGSLMATFGLMIMMINLDVFHQVRVAEPFWLLQGLTIATSGNLASPNIRQHR
jgi:hypothetical protein